MDPAQDLNQLTQNPTPTFADDVEEFEEKQNDFQAMYDAGGHFKEQLEAIAQKTEALATGEPEVTIVTEVATTPEVGPEVARYVEKVEKEPELNQALADDYVRQVGMVTAAPTEVQVKIPLTSGQIQLGLHRKVWEAIRWLAVWCLRQMKMVKLEHA